MAQDNVKLLTEKEKDFLQKLEDSYAVKFEKVFTKERKNDVARMIINNRVIGRHPKRISHLIRELTTLKKEHGDLELIYSTDDEGNDFDEVKFYPTLFVQDIDGIGARELSYQHFSEVTDKKLGLNRKPTHLCIN